MIREFFYGKTIDRRPFRNGDNDRELYSKEEIYVRFSILSADRDVLKQYLPIFQAFQRKSSQ